jgi:hypothetical protein
MDWQITESCRLTRGGLVIKDGRLKWQLVSHLFYFILILSSFLSPFSSSSVGPMERQPKNRKNTVIKSKREKVNLKFSCEDLQSSFGDLF